MDPPVAPEPLIGRLRQAAASQLVGRDSERRQLTGLIDVSPGPAVVFVHGPGGIGKSVLVAGVLADLERPSVLLDGRAIEPTATGFLTALGNVLDAATPVSPADAAALLEAKSVGVIAVDSFDRLNLLDGWLRNEFVPALSEASTTILVTRGAMNVAWRTSPGWRLLTAEVFVGDLSDADAAALVARRGLPPESAARVLEFGRGHPLALELAAEALARHSGLDIPSGPPADVIEELFDILLDDLPAAQRRTVETASILRRVTMPLLSAVLDPTGQDVESAWRTLRDLPFSSMSRAGLELDPLPRTVIAGALEIRDPAAVARVRSAAARAALREAGGTRNWDTTADLLYLVQNPVIRNSYLPATGHQHPVEAAVRDDRDEILAITRQYDGAEGATAISRWWETHPGSFVVARGEAGPVTAYGAVARLSEIDPVLAAADPLTAAVLRDTRLRPPPPESEILLSRRSLGSRRGESASPELGSIVVDLKRLYLELRPRLARVYAVVGDWQQVGPVMRLMGFGRVEGEIRLGGAGFHLCALDFGPGSVDGWLARHVLVESGEPAEPDPDSNVSEPAIPLNAARPPVARLSAREREVLTALADGLTNVQLANRLFISERTANRHVSNIYTKLGVRNRTSAARIAIEAGLAG